MKTQSFNNQFYLQEDIGNQSLLDFVLNENYNENAYQYYEKSLEELGFFNAGYGCMTCIGNSGELD